jgi:hypothetical protein
MARPEELGRGLALEAAALKEGNDPLLYRERRAYLKAIQEAQAGAEAARTVLAGLWHPGVRVWASAVGS